MSGRVGTSLLSSLGLSELSFHSVKELENAAVVLAQSPGKLSALRKRRERRDCGGLETWRIVGAD